MSSLCGYLMPILNQDFQDYQDFQINGMNALWHSPG